MACRSVQEPIHSGHFMTSNPHTEDPQADEEDVEVDVVEDDDKPEDSISSSKDAALDEKPVTFYKFGPKKTQSIAIDVSLNKLNKCIKVAYNKMTTPKWKDFKGLKLHWKQRIRLNNVIWRAYHIEFRRPRPKRTKKTPFCYFSVPDDDSTHAKIEGSVLEGMYWKRRMEAVCAQYKRWRHFMKTRRQFDRPPKRKRPHSEGGTTAEADRRGEPANKQQRSQTPMNMGEYLDYDDFENCFTDELFESLSQPYMFPNPREIMQSGYADIMQPGLMGLQPSLEEIMAQIDEHGSMNSGGHMLPQRSSSAQPRPSASALHQGASGTTTTRAQQIPMGPPQTCSRIGGGSRVPSNSNNGIQQRHDYQQPHVVDYSADRNVSLAGGSPREMHMQPTRQSSTMTSSQLLLMSQAHSTTTGQPHYSSATYNQQPLAERWKTSTSGFVFSDGQSASSSSASSSTTGGGMDYVPQFQTFSPQGAPTSVGGGGSGLPSTSVVQSRQWWLDSPMGSQMSGGSTGPSTPMGALSIVSTSSSLTTPNPLTTLEDILAVQSGKYTGTPPLVSRPEMRSPVVVRSAQDFRSQGFIHDAQMDTSMKPPTSLPSPTHPHRTIDQNDFCDRPKNVGVPADWLLGPMASTSTAPTPFQRNTSNMATNNLYQSEVTTPVYPSLVTSYPTTTKPRLPLVMPGSSTTSKFTRRRSSVEETKAESFMKEEPHTPVTGTGGNNTLIHSSASGSASGSSQSMQAADSTLNPEERKRMMHLHAEQSRRTALKDGFDQLMEMIPDIYAGGVKPTNAVVLAKSAEQIRHLMAEKETQNAAKAELQEKIARLQGRISALQSNLPAASGLSGAKMDPRTALDAYYEQCTKERARADWRFWVMSRMLQPLIVGQPNSFAAQIAPDGSSREEIAASCSDWLNSHWRASELRPLASTLLVNLATNSSVLTNPESLEDYVKEQMNNPL